MKKILIPGALMLGLFFTACSTEVSEDLENVLENLEAEESKLTCSELKEKVDEYEGKEVTLTAVSWGNLGTMDGGVSMNLGDEKLEGMKVAPVVAEFGENQAEAANAIKRDATVTIKATVGGEAYGSVKLENPSIVK
ncbi:MAG: hypothetical protein AB8B56_16255 [Crocinitomicaceae bacterium]